MIKNKKTVKTEIPRIHLQKEPYKIKGKLKVVQQEETVIKLDPKIELTKHLIVFALMVLTSYAILAIVFHK